MQQQQDSRTKVGRQSAGTWFSIPTTVSMACRRNALTLATFWAIDATQHSAIIKVVVDQVSTERGHRAFITVRACPVWQVARLSPTSFISDSIWLDAKQETDPIEELPAGSDEVKIWATFDADHTGCIARQRPPMVLPFTWEDYPTGCKFTLKYL